MNWRRAKRWLSSTWALPVAVFLVGLAVQVIWHQKWATVVVEVLMTALWIGFYATYKVGATTGYVDGYAVGRYQRGTEPLGFYGHSAAGDCPRCDQLLSERSDGTR